MLGLSAQGETTKHFARSTGLGEILSNLKIILSLPWELFEQQNGLE